jgi:hypothetical protein
LGHSNSAQIDYNVAAEGIFAGFCLHIIGKSQGVYGETGKEDLRNSSKANFINIPDDFNCETSKKNTNRVLGTLILEQGNLEK